MVNRLRTRIAQEDSNFTLQVSALYMYMYIAYKEHNGHQNK